MVAEHGAVPRLPAWRLRGTPSQMTRSEPATPTATVASPLPVPTGPTLTAAYADRLEALAHGCPQLKHVALWLCKTVTDQGAVALLQAVQPAANISGHLALRFLLDSHFNTFLNSFFSIYTVVTVVIVLFQLLMP